MKMIKLAMLCSAVLVCLLSWPGQTRAAVTNCGEMAELNKVVDSLGNTVTMNTGDYDYSITIPHTVSNYRLTFDVCDSPDTVTTANSLLDNLLGILLANGNTTEDLDLVRGDNVFTIMVKHTYAVILMETHEYTFHLNYYPDLSDLQISGQSISPVFDPETLNYSATVPNSASELSLSATLSDPDTSALFVNGTAVDSGLAHSVPLFPGANTIEIAAVSSDGKLTTTYELSVYRMHNDSSLENLEVDGQSLSPDFSATEKTYVINDVGYGTEFITVRPTVPASAHSTMTLEAGGSAISPSSGNEYAVPLNEGYNTIVVSVTAEDGTSYSDY
jgi:hypothetical protein